MELLKKTRPPILRVLFLALLAGSACTAPRRDAPAPLERIAIADDGQAFVLQPSGRPFVPWGFNYDHDAQGRLLEAYWDSEWETVAEDFREMKALGANVVRIHPQFGRFMRGPDEPDAEALDRLGRLVALAERCRLYLDITGLGCYLKDEVPDWYDALPESQRWDAQARFWAAIARRCAASPGIFCYDLMNEPVVGGRREPGQWLGPPFAGKFHFVQFITLDRANRPRPEIARRWIRRLSTAIREHDPHHMITVGLVPWSLDRPGLSSGFVPEHIAPELDFISVHLYPETGKLDEAMTTLQGFAVGKPVVIEETFPLKCPAADLERFLERSTAVASGWVGFYWGKTPDEYRNSHELVDTLALNWLELFQKGPPTQR